MFLPPAPLALFAALTVLLSGCAGLQPLKPLDPALKSALLSGCRTPFLQTAGRLVHTLEMALSGGAAATAIGVMTADPAAGGFRTTLMTVEGMVLFDVEAAGEKTIVHRAVPPFDRPAFAEGLAEDIRLAFFHPGGEPAAWGADHQGDRVCRFLLADGRIEEVRTRADGRAEILLYRTGQDLLKKVEIASRKGAGPADFLEIRGYGWSRGYRLRLRLLESETPESDPGMAPEAATGGSRPSGDGNTAEEGTRMP